MLEPVHLNNRDRVKEVRKRLEDHHTPLLVEFCAQWTRHPILLVEGTSCVRCGEPGYSQGHIVGIVEFGKGLYPLTLGYVRVGYLQEKLGISNLVDATNLTAFLNALGYPDGVDAYLDSIHLDGDHVDHDAPGGSGVR